MQALRAELKSVVGRHVEQANDRELLGIITALYGPPRESSPPPAPASKDCASAPWLVLPRFELVSDAVTLDRDTGLTWTRRNVSDKRLTWEEATKVCAELALDGGGWRLPTIKELLSLVDYECHNPAIDASVFTCESAWYWTSTPYAPFPGDCAWGVNFYYGDAGCSDRGSGGFVRAVRAGQ